MHCSVFLLHSGILYTIVFFVVRVNKNSHVSSPLSIWPRHLLYQYLCAEDQMKMININAEESLGATSLQYYSKIVHKYYVVLRSGQCTLQKKHQQWCFAVVCSQVIHQALSNYLVFLLSQWPNSQSTAQSAKVTYVLAYVP